MSTASIIGIGTACPENTMTQTEALSMFTDIVCVDEREKRLAKVLFRKSGVRNRHLVVPHTVAYAWCQPSAVAVSGDGSAAVRGELLKAPETLPDVVPGKSAGPTTSERMQMYREFASGLALQSAELALADAQVEAREITHLITVTCTGFDSPGVDFELINRLGLPATTQRVNIGFMGCHAAINGLRTAMAISRSDPNAKVLMTAVELCSLHYRFQWEMEHVIGNALFADGSASVVVGNSESLRTPSAEIATAATANFGAAKTRPDSTWKLAGCGSVLIPDSSEAMSWKVGDYGFQMMLTNEIGEMIQGALECWLVDWLGKFELTLADIDLWGVHPGGPRILSAVQDSLALTNDDLATSRSILERYGNMSSPTVLFILQDFVTAQFERGENTSGSNCLLLAFGPGLVAEIALLQRM